MGAAGLDFIDLTLEPPGAASWRLDISAVRAALERHSLRVVGHTAPYLPVASPMDALRTAAIEEFRRCLQVFHAVGASWMNIHPGTAQMHDWRYSINRNIESLRELIADAQGCGMGVMVENMPGHFNTASEMGELLEPLPELGLHLDIGHTNLMTPCNTEGEILSAYAGRLKHVHFHDNRGGNLDLHLALGAGNINIRESVRLLKQSGYDGTITLEVFATDTNHLLYSRDVLRKLWDSV